MCGSNLFSKLLSVFGIAELFSQTPNGKLMIIEAEP